jgi:hypothetical protein
MAGATQPASPLLRVTLAGGLAIFVADDPRPATLPAGKAVTLLALLLARRGRLVLRLAVIPQEEPGSSQSVNRARRDRPLRPQQRRSSW